jgi:putative membrane protein
VRHHVRLRAAFANMTPHKKERTMKITLSLTLGVLSVAALAACTTQRVVAVPAPTAVVVAPAPAPTTVLGATAPAVQFSAADTHFIAVAAGAGMYEVEAARLALTRAGNPQVRSYAQMLLDHHTASNKELTTLVGSKGHRVAPGLPAELQQKIGTLTRLSGADFDREFVRMTGVQDHSAAIAAFEQGQRSVADRDLRAFIDKSLPVLRSHLQQAQDLAGRMAG